jgi:hypothetical protein
MAREKRKRPKAQTPKGRQRDAAAERKRAEAMTFKPKFPELWPRRN